MIKGCLITAIYLLLTIFLSFACLYFGTKDLKITNPQIFMIVCGVHLLQPFVESFMGFIKGLSKQRRTKNE